ncbi:hypothetical protein BGZ76_003694 [Entomortierella beljakovae]|nr:hypothetical protein BGZ76_003694 [Entomortierella beljakovae]
MLEPVVSTSSDRYVRDSSESTLIDTENVQDRHKPGLHGRARIWGPNKTIRMVLLTTALMGLQFTWSVEMAYGTPFLLQLGLSKSLMSLVWLAGPLSGLVMQPVVGVLSDKCTSKFGRRRPFLAVGVMAVVVSFLCLGWCREIIRGIFGSDYSNLQNVTILMAVVSIFILDFAINCVQASCRTLIVDSLPSSQQEVAASWASRLMGIGGIFGYFMGNVDLPRIFPSLGDTQFKGLCIIACMFLILTVGATCVAVTERVMVRELKTSGSSIDDFFQGFKTIFKAMRYLPTRIQHLCNVQLFAWMGWFPFLFYSSTYIAEIYTQEKTLSGTPIDPTPQPDQDQTSGVEDAAVRAGSFCLFIYSVVSLIASIVLPVFVMPADQISTGSSGPFSNSGLTGSIRSPSSKWGNLRIPRWLRLPIQGLTLPKLYTLSLVLLSFSLVSTWYVHDLRGSTILFSCCGIAWAVSMWAPFSILGEVISQQMQEEQHQERNLASSQLRRGGSSEVLFNKGDEDEDGEEIEEIGMSESSHGKQYKPLRGRESLDEVVIIPESNTKANNRPGITSSDSFRSRNGTPSPTATEGWSGVLDQGKTMDSDSEAEESNSDHRGASRPFIRTETSSSSTPSSGPTEGASAGALLGIHNVYIVLPQFLVSFLSSLVFAAIEPSGSNDGGSTDDSSDQPGNPDTIGVVLRIGGVMAGVAALLSLRLWKQPRTAPPSHV